MLPLTTPNLILRGDGESEVPGLDEALNEELLTLCQLVSRVLQSDQVEHTLDKGVGHNTCYASGVEDLCHSE